jgi:pimeloyl-ACP methyl ester carboxylesterase
VLDRPGTGLSEPVRPAIRDPRTLVAHADRLVAAVLDALAIERADVNATSLGGLFGLRFGLAAPGRLRRFVGIGWLVGAPAGRLPASMRLGSTPAIGRLAARLPVTDGMVRRMWRTLGMREAVDGGRVPPEAVSAYAALIRHTETMRNDLDLGAGVLAGGRVTDRLALTDSERARFAAPALFAWGDRDAFGGLDIARPFVAGFPDARLRVLPGAGHAPWMDDPDGVASLVEGFLRAP